MFLDFENTEIAFKAKTNLELKKSYFLFQFLNSPKFVKWGTNATRLALFFHLPIDYAVKLTLFEQFCGGSHINECEKTIENLYRFKIGTILDYSVEGGKSEKDFNSTLHEILKTVKFAKNNPKISFCVYKVSGLGPHELLERVSAGFSLSKDDIKAWERVKERNQIICEEAFKNGVKVFIDAEETWIQNAIDKTAEEMMRLFNKEKAVVYHTVQLYRRDRLQYLKNIIEKSVIEKYHLGLKLVRGAYMEKERDRASENGYPSPIHPSKIEVDQDYNAALKHCLENANTLSLCAGTHNEESTRLLVEGMKKNNISNQSEQFYFSQLFGMSDNLSFNLAAAGYNVAKYVPYGPIRSMMPYLFRRAQENTSIQGQTTRELELVALELKRRGKT